MAKKDGKQHVEMARGEREKDEYGDDLGEEFWDDELFVPRPRGPSRLSSLGLPDTARLSLLAGKRKSLRQSSSLHSSERPSVDDSLLPPDLREYRNFADRVSRPSVAGNFSPPESQVEVDAEHVLELKASLGYDSRKRGNLNVLTDEVLLIIAGAYLRVHNLCTGQDTYLRATGSGAIACVSVHPQRIFFASGETGTYPDINVFEYPSCKLYKVLSDGTETHYQCLAFSPDEGQLLVAQGGDADFLLCIWDWEKETPLLRCKNVPHEIHGLAFSQHLPGRLISYGAGHIRFWSIASTFTGLKLKFDSGKFGSLDISDIYGGLQLPDGQSMTGSEWGSLLVWEEGIVKAQILVQGNHRCHQGRINQLVLHEGELYTVAEDGNITMWKLEELSNVDPEYPGATHCTRPLFHLEVSPNARLMQMDEMYLEKPSHHEEETLWYVQDAGGKVWQVDLSFSNRAQQPKVMLNAHGGPVVACAASPVSHVVITGGVDKTVRLFDCLRRTELSSMTFYSQVSTLMWMPLSADPHGCSVVVGFVDGSLRKVVFRRSRGDVGKKPGQCPAAEMCLSQVFKPHKAAITSVAFSPDGRLLATGSREGSVFLFQVEESDLQPFGWMFVPQTVESLEWTPPSFSYLGLLLACEGSVVIELHVPPQLDITRTEKLQMLGVKHRVFLLQSVKSREVYLVRKRQMKREHIQQLLAIRKKKLAWGLITESELALATPLDASGSDVQLDDDFVPELPPTPSRVVQAIYDRNDEQFIWLSMADYDAGYLYQCMMPLHWSTGDVTTDKVAGTEPIMCVGMSESDDKPISVLKFSADGKVACVGYANGKVGIIHLKVRYDLRDLRDAWHLCVHDRISGCLTGVQLAFDKSFLLTTGTDGNIFLFSYCGKLQQLPLTEAELPDSWDHHSICGDDLVRGAVCLREEIDQNLKREELERAECSKRERRVLLLKMKKQLAVVVQHNAGLPPHLRLTQEELRINPRLIEECQTQTAAAIDKVKKMSGWSSEKNTVGLKKMVEAFKPLEDSDVIILKDFKGSKVVRSFRIVPMPACASTVLDATDEEPVTVTQGRTGTDEGPDTHVLKHSRSDELFQQLYDGFRLGSIVGPDARRLRCGMEYIRKAREKRAIRRMDWERLFKLKPPEDYDDPKAMAAIEEAKRTIGVKILRDHESHVKDLSVQRVMKNCLFRLAHIDREIQNKMLAFNHKLQEMRMQKYLITQFVKKRRQTLLADVTRLQQKWMEAGMEGGLERVDLPDVPLLDEEEVPETRYTFDDKDLVKFREQGEDGPSSQEVRLSANLATFGRREKRGSIKTAKAETSRKPRVYYRGEAREPPALVRALHTQMEDEKQLLNRLDLGTVERDDDVLEGAGNTSPLQQEMLMIERITLTHDLTVFHDTVHKLIQSFEEDFDQLLNEKSQLEILLKRAKLFHITLLEELLISRSSASSENNLIMAVSKAEKDLLRHDTAKDNLEALMAHVSGQLDLLGEESTQLLYTFEDLTRDTVPKRQKFLAKIFRKRVKIKRERTDSDSSSSSSGSSITSDDSDANSEDEKVHDDLGVCPDDLDQDLFDATWALQKERQRVDDTAASLTLILDRHRKDMERLLTQTEPLAKAVRGALGTLYQYRSHIQEQVNNLHVIVPLTTSQMDARGRPLTNDLFTQSLVLESCELRTLQRRPKALGQELQQQQEAMKQDSLDFAALRRRHKILERKLAAGQRICDDEMMKKFGCLVALDKLEMAMVNPRMEILRSLLTREKNDQAEEIRQCDAQIKDLRSKIIEAMKMNTEMLHQKAELKTQWLSLVKKLDKSLKKNNMPDLALGKPGDIRGLQVLVQEQLEEIRWCRQEIESLRRTPGLPRCRPYRRYRMFHSLPAVSLDTLRTQAGLTQP